MTTLTVAGYAIGGLDSFSSVVDAAANLNNDPHNPKLIAAYEAALANAAAAVTATVQGAGAAFAGNAIIANINNLTTNYGKMSQSDIQATLISITGELITLAGQGVSFYGAERNEGQRRPWRSCIHSGPAH
jgi:hypothetical protein